MGCLFELIFEIVFTVIVEATLTIYMELMSLIVPAHQFDERLKEKIKNGLTVFAVLLFFCSIIGFFLFLQPPSITKTIGAYMLFVALGIIGFQILLGIVYRIIKAINSKR